MQPLYVLNMLTYFLMQHGYKISVLPHLQRTTDKISEFICRHFPNSLLCEAIHSSDYSAVQKLELSTNKQLDGKNHPHYFQSHVCRYCLTLTNRPFYTLVCLFKQTPRMECTFQTQTIYQYKSSVWSSSTPNDIYQFFLFPSHTPKHSSSHSLVDLLQSDQLKHNNHLCATENISALGLNK